MSGVHESSDSLLKEANSLELKHEWRDASETYSKALALCPKSDYSQMGLLHESCGLSLHRWSFTANERDEFLLRTERAVEQYKEAKLAHGKAGGELSACRQRRCDAMLSLLGYWATEGANHKKNLLKESWSNAVEALSELEMQNAREEFGSTFNLLSIAAVISYNYDDTAAAREEHLKQLMSFSEKAIKFLSGKDSPSELAKAYATAGAVTSAIGKDFADFGKKDELDLKAWNYWLRGRELSEDEMLFDIPFPSMLQGWPSACSIDERRKISEKAKLLAERTGDNWLMGFVMNNLAARYMMMSESEEEASGRETLVTRALEYARRSKKCFDIMGFVSTDISQIWVQVPEAGFYNQLWSQETDPKKRRDLMEKAYEHTVEQTKMASESKYPDVEAAARFMLGILLTEMGKKEPSFERKRMYLTRASEHLEKAAASDVSLHPNLYYLHGIDLSCLADAGFELAAIMEKGAERISTLREAVVRKRDALTLSERHLLVVQDNNPNVWAGMGEARHKMGEWAIQLYELSPDLNDLVIVADAYDKSVEWYTKAGNPGRIAESNWRAAQSYDMMGEFQKASERFAKASDGYRMAGGSIPHLKQLYDDYAIYMQAWGEIERARYCHSRQEPSLAGKCYEKAASLHASTTRWSYLAPNYHAWAILEKAEDLSRAEKCEESIGAFEEASAKFAESKTALSEHLPRIEDPEELLMVRKLEKGAEIRRGYCSARTCLEEAKVLQRRGDPLGSSERYGVAVERFQDLSKELESDLDRKECGLTIALARAWQVMARAEAESSSQLYEEASRLFEEAKNLSPGDKGKLLAMGHSRFCKALEAGIRFADTRDPALYATAIKHLDSAANHYARAGAESASEYSRASKLLFDAYASMDRAGQETDHEKKAKAYLAVEKILEASAAGFGQAEQPGKKDQVLRLLESVKRERELAVSLTELFHAPLVASSTASFASPTPTYEQPVGLERFEHADIQANLIAPKKDLKMDEYLEMEIELVNAGRGPAQLIKLQDLVPKGFTLREEPEGYRMEDSCLNLRGKRLDPLKTEGIKLVLKPTQRGQFALRPRVLYLDESGKYKSHEPEPMMVTVGIETTASSADKVVYVDTREAAEARSLLAGLNVVTLSHYRIVGNYVRYGKAVCNALKDARQKIIAACQGSSPKRENYIIWAPPGSGKTYFVQEVAALLGDSIHYCELNLAKLDETGFRSGLAELRTVQGPSLCLVDEVDAKPNEPWPYETLMPFLDLSATEGARLVFVLAGSSGSSVEEMKKAMSSRPKGSDILSRVPTDNEYSIPPMGVGDRLLVVLSQFRQAGKQMGHDVREVEKLGLYYVALNPRLSNARQLREFAVRCAERVLPGDDRLKYDSLFRPGDLENKLFWTQALQSAGALVDSFLLVED